MNCTLRTAFLMLLATGTFPAAYGQGVLIGVNQDTPHPASALEIRSTSQGLLPPRLSTVERDAITNPPAGLRIYNTDTGCENFYSEVTGEWMALCGSCAPVAPYQVSHDATFYNVTWTWEPVPGADGYKWNTTNDFFSATDLGSSTSVTHQAEYSGAVVVIYVWSYNEACGESERPRRLTASSCPWISVSPSNHVVSANQIIWLFGGNEASGYRVNTVNDYSTAIDVPAAEGYMQSYIQTGLEPGTSYELYVWAYSALGSSCISDATLLQATTGPAGCTVGATGPGGGLVMYCGNAYPGKTGLEISGSDNSAGTQWGCLGTDVPGAGASQLGTGAQNTLDIVSGCAAAGIAARVCADLVQGGQSDWFLPAQEEMSNGWNNLNYTPGALAAGQFQSSYYWSSTEDNGMWSTSRALVFHMGNGGGLNGPQKSESYPVRCVRAF